MPFIDLAWWQWFLFPVLFYAYGIATTTKYYHFRQQLDFEETDKDEVFLSLLWPMMIFHDPDRLRGLFLPTLWLWPRFRAEYPKLKAYQKKDAEAKRQLQMKQFHRDRRQRSTELILEDTKAEVRFEHETTQMSKETETLREALIKGPPEIEDPTIRQLAKSAIKKKLEKAAEVEQDDPWCNYHQARLSGHYPNTNCDTDVLQRARALGRA